MDTKYNESILGDKKLLSLFCVSFIIALVLEFIIFNFPFWYSLQNHHVPNYSYTLTINEDNTAELLYENIKTHVNNIYLNPFMDDATIGDRINLHIWVTDGGAEFLYDIGNTEIVYGIEESYYLKLNLVGDSSSIRIVLSPVDSPVNDSIKTDLNVIRPFSFHIFRFLGVLFIGIIISFFVPSSILYRKQLSFNDIEQKKIIIFFIIINIFSVLSVGIISKFKHDDIISAQALTQYELQAEAFYNGRLNIGNELPPESLVNMKDPYDTTAREVYVDDTYYADVAYYNGNYYSYFGVVPTVFLFLPFLLLTKKTLETAYAVIFFAVLIIPIIYWFLYSFIKRYNYNLSLGLYLLLTSSLVYTTGLLYIVKIPTTYSVPIVSSLFFMILGLAFWLNSSYKNRVKLFLGGLFIALTLGCRPQYVLVFLLAFVIFSDDIKNGHFFGSIKNKRFEGNSIINTCCVISPFIIVGVLLAIYNYLRFESPFQFGAVYNLTSSNLTNSGFIVSRLFDGVFYYLFQPFNINAKFPYLYTLNVGSNSLPSDYLGQFICEPFMAGFFAFAPLALMIVLIKFVHKELQNNKTIYYFVFGVIYSLLIICFDSQLIGVNMRYIIDFSFVLLFSIVVVIFGFSKKYENHKYYNYFVYTVILLTFIGVFVNFLALLGESRYNSMMLNQPYYFYSLKYLIFSIR